jgi:hypothetical protein
VIPGSLLLILLAVALLAFGLVQGSNPYLVGSIAASLLAAIALIAGSRRAGRGGGEVETDDRDHDDVETDDRERAGAARTARRHGPREAPTEMLRTAREGGSERRRDLGDGGFRDDDRRDEEVEAVGRRLQTIVEPAIPAQGSAPEVDRGLDRGRGASQHAAVNDDDYDDEDPADEPVAQQVSPADSARVARLSTDVLVIAGRPRYHLAGCVHLLGRESEPLPVAEAIELGFTPCGLCEPDSALLADARRV